MFYISEYSLTRYYKLWIRNPKLTLTIDKQIRPPYHFIYQLYWTLAAIARGISYKLFQRLLSTPLGCVSDVSLRLWRNRKMIRAFNNIIDVSSHQWLLKYHLWSSIYILLNGLTLLSTLNVCGFADGYELPWFKTLRWRHNDHAGVSNHQPHGCLLNRLFRGKSKKTSKLRVTGLCAGNSPGTGEFPAQMASYAENVSIWWRHHDFNHFQRSPSAT